MTARLIALMSFVLLLSLAAFALLVNRYQEEVMGEVERAVTDAGRATLLQFEAQLPTTPGVALRRTPQVLVRVPPPGTGAVGSGSASWTEQSEVETHGEAVQVERRIEVFQERDSTARTAPSGIVILRVGAPQPEGVRTGSGPSSGGASGELDHPAAAGLTGALAASTSSGHLLHREIRLPVPTADFQARFAGLRRRSLLVFLVVFLVGTALSAALAHRFTRPIRALDAGLHRLAEGDLEVAVEARGKDELARLGVAFNEVARRLRSSREREREVTRREKLSALGRLAAGVAHDVRNPLHSIGLTLDHMEDGCRPEAPERAAEQSRLLSLVRSEIRRLDRLVENFLRFARSERRSHEPVDLTAIARETERLVEREALRRRVAVRVEAEPGLPPVVADAEAVRSALLNLVLNAFEAMPEGGELVLNLRRSEDAIELVVADTGLGIPESEQEKVFEFAYTTRDGGSGLGLAMVHQTVVEDHGGRVVLESRPGAGTRVRLLLPLAAGGAA